MQQIYSPVPGKGLSPPWLWKDPLTKKKTQLHNPAKKSLIPNACLQTTDEMTGHSQGDMGTGSPHLPSWIRPSLNLQGDLHTQGLKRWWTFWPCYKACACCAQGVPTASGASICSRIGYRALNNKGKEFHTLHVLSLVLVRVGLRLSCVFFTLGTRTDYEACFLSFCCEGCLCKLLDLVFSCFISSHMIAGSGSLCIYGCFFGEILRDIQLPLLNWLAPEQVPESHLSGRAWCSPQCSEQSGSLPATRQWGSVPFTGAILLGLCPSHWQHFQKLKKACLSPCSFKCRQANAMAI